MSNIKTEDLERVVNFGSLVALLRDNLDWPLDEEGDFEDITFDWDADELGLKDEEVAKVREIHQLRPLTTGQPWGIFFISFEEKSVSVTVLRRMLRALVVKKRAGSQSSSRQAWQQNDLIFVTNFGASGAREIAFAHFSDTGGAGGLPALRVLGWNALDTRLHNEYVVETLSSKLRWPEHPEDHDKWRSEWRGAFELEHRQVVRTSQELAKGLADLAANIRARANELLEAETEQGNLRKMLAAFRKNLIHDLDEDGFADMFAQTISYGLLASYISRPKGEATPDSLVEMIPSTNPFLRELFSSFLSLGGQDKRQVMDFDELGVRDVIELLENANLEAVLRDFGDRNPKEDPVIHFYELFLKEYDPEKRMQRGVFYTPRPVVNFIVRGVDEILRTEFDLPLGLADTTTWGELAARNDKIVVPDHIDPDEPFVQILDPATGTGTFLVEVIDLIHDRMVEFWNSEGRSAADIAGAWNEYVPQHLLPRLTAYELMMAPYSIAHLKIGLKLRETGYKFGSDERARVYLTNALEPARDLDMEFVFMSEALAHEAQEANDAKAKASTTIVIGNPPYSVKSFNMGKWITELCERYKELVRKQESQIQSLSNDYIKFMRLAEDKIETSQYGVLGMITGHGYMLGTQPRDLRKSLFSTFNNLLAVNLNGSVRRDGVGVKDDPIFEIMTGVGVGLFFRSNPKAKSLSRYVSVEGPYDEKEGWLLESSVRRIQPERVIAKAPNFFLWPAGELQEEFESFFDLPDLFGSGDRSADKETYWSTGFASQQDDFAIALDRQQLVDRMQDLADSASRQEISQKYKMCSTNQWNYEKAVLFASAGKWQDSIEPVAYRPFDVRLSVIDPNVLTILKNSVQRNFEVDNLALLTSRIVNDQNYAHCFVSDRRTDKIFLSSKTSTNAYVFPLWLRPMVEGENRYPNICKQSAITFSERIGLAYDDGITKASNDGVVSDSWIGRGDLGKSFGPRDLFEWIYAILHSPTYRTRYDEFLKTDFPRIPTPSELSFFKLMACKGSDLLALHLLSPNEARVLENPSIRFAGSGEARVEKGYPKYENGRIMVNGTRWFEDVPKATWDFYVGGYQVCQKWLKDRAGKGGKKPSPGRVLTDEDILHYRRVVVALTETRRLMGEIDEVIEKHGGWPEAFYLPPPPPPSVEEIIEADESRELEFKSTFQWDMRQGKQNTSLRKQVLKSLAAFMNTKGGTLVIGVTDDKEIIGLEHDLKLVKDSLDAFENSLLSVFGSTIGAPYSLHCKLRFADAPDGKKVCVIDVTEAKEPVFVEFEKQQEFFIRRGNATVSLNASEQHAYTRERF